MVIFLVRECRKKCYKKAIQLAILFAVIPAAVNSVFLTADLSTTNIYSLMMFAGVMTYVGFIYMLERLNLEEVQQMPAYPSEGSIKIVEGTIVVKFAN